MTDGLIDIKQKDVRVNVSVTFSKTFVNSPGESKYTEIKCLCN